MILDLFKLDGKAALVTGADIAGLDRNPAARWGTPGDLKGAVLFLAYSASDTMHGAIIPVDGGW